jgi:hypothetical protein
MGIITRWDDKQQTIVLLEFETSWTLDDLKQAVQEADALIGSVDHRVDLLIDIEDSRMPSDFMGMARVLLADGEARGNEGRRVVVGASALFRQGYNAVKAAFRSKLEGREISFAADRDEARAILRSLRG